MIETGVCFVCMICIAFITAQVLLRTRSLDSFCQCQCVGYVIIFTYETAAHIAGRRDREPATYDDWANGHNHRSIIGLQGLLYGLKSHVRAWQALLSYEAIAYFFFTGSRISWFTETTDCRWFHSKSRDRTVLHFTDSVFEFFAVQITSDVLGQR